MSEAIDLARLGRFLDGTASAEERAGVEAWIGADAERRRAIATLRAAWTADAERFGAPYDVDGAWARLSDELQGARPAVGIVARAGWRRTARAAAVLALLGGAAGWWLMLRRPAPSSIAEAAPVREYVTPRGRRAAFRLLDGTEITLNADSRLRVLTPFGAGGREVYLDGEAYFSVVHDSAHPFVVHTSQSAIRDIGTKFGVHAYGDAAVQRIAVAEGEVGLASAGGPATAETSLRAGQVATLSRAGRVSVLRGGNVDQELAWTRGRLTFASLPLGEAVRRIGRWYDLDVRVTDPELARRPVTGSYGDEPATEVLSLITAAVGARFEWHARSVTISSATTTR